MKITTQTLFLTLALILGSSQLALSSNNSLKIAKQGMLSDSTKLISKNLPTSVYQIKNTTEKQNSVFDQMAMMSNDLLELKLTTDLQNLIINKNTDDYQVAFIEMKDANGNSVNHKLKVKARGKYRRKVCDFPPLKLNFAKEELIKHGLHSEFDKLKLVTHCTDNKTDAKDNVLREYLTYQIYNRLTDNSFRTQLVKIEYVDLHNSSKSITRYGFVIEDKDEMAMRLNGEICDCHGLKSEMISKTPYNLMAMFQYMIGNEDWDSSMIRNVQAVQLFTGGSIGNNIIVPYDFDFSGVVDAPYAIPDLDLKHYTVKQRHFSGEFNDKNELEAMINHFLSRKNEILQTVKKFKRLNLNSRFEIEIYLQEFFLILENEKLASAIFLKNQNISFQENN
jgi:hypothetical protein